MDTDRQIVALVERAMDDRPLCTRCGDTMTVVAVDDRLWLECASGQRERHGLDRVFDVIVGHDRELVVDLVPVAA